MRRSNQLFWSAASFLVGMVFSSLYGLELSIQAAVLLLSAIVAVFMLRSSKLVVIPLVVTLFTLGGLRYNFFTVSQPMDSIDDYQYGKHEVLGVVDGEPYRDARSNYVFYVSQLRVDGQATAGTLRVKSLIANAKEGYSVRVVGKIMPSLGRTSSGMSYARVTVVSAQHNLLVQIKSQFSEGVRRALPEPTAGFMLGILIGSRSSLSPELQNTMSQIGLSHLIAVSGYNLTIIALAIQAMLGKKWQWGTLAATLWLIVGFVVLTGASASIVRAGVMAALFLLAKYYGRRLEVLSCLAVGVILTLAWDPSYLTDLSWQLSFLALTGIVLLTPAITKLFPSRLGAVGDIAAVSIAAQLATMPLIAFVFGDVALIAPLTNLVYLPLIPLLMLFGFMAGVVGALLPSTAYAIFWPVHFGVTFLLDGMAYFASWRYSTIQNAAPSFVGLGLFYTALGILALLARRSGPSLGSSTLDAIITGKKQENSA